MGLHITSHVVLPPERLPGSVPIDGNNKRDAKIVYFYSNYRYWILDYAETFINGRAAIELENPDTFVNDAGFAFLALVNGYFDMIGQLCGSDGDKYDCYREWDGSKNRFKTFSVDSNKNWNKWDSAQKPNEKKRHKPKTDRCVWYGLTAILYDDYEKFKSKNQKAKTNIDWAKFCRSFYRHTRNPVAHTTFPSKLLITRDSTPFPWVVEKVKGRNLLLINLPGWYEKISNHFEQYALRIRFPKTNDDRVLRKRFLKRYRRLKE